MDHSEVKRWGDSASQAQLGEHLGVARELARIPQSSGADHGAKLLEAYPVDKTGRAPDDWMWFGAKSMYDKAGFAEVARRRPERPIVRIALAPDRPQSRTPGP